MQDGLLQMMPGALVDCACWSVRCQAKLHDVAPCPLLRARCRWPCSVRGVGSEDGMMSR
jgi:hypothetical protein